MATKITLTVNGKDHRVTTDPDRSLLEVLREDLGLMGTKYACGEGQCGACSVLVGDNRVLSCVFPASRADKKAVTTIEGLSTGERLHPVQEAFLAEGAMQCGYCTSGMVIAAVALLRKNPQPTDEEIVKAMNRNLCRCNGYTRILKAVRRAAGMMRR
jgi:aerobic-type carbon monoxide dehydrogenase small subunit (CoxS/CutS family)